MSINPYVPSTAFARIFDELTDLDSGPLESNITMELETVDTIARERQSHGTDSERFAVLCLMDSLESRGFKGSPAVQEAKLIVEQNNHGAKVQDSIILLANVVVEEMNGRFDSDTLRRPKEIATSYETIVKKDLEILDRVTEKGYVIKDAKEAKMVKDALVRLSHNNHDISNYISPLLTEAHQNDVTLTSQIAKSVAHNIFNKDVDSS